MNSEALIVPLATTYAAMSAVAFLTYGWDKSCAKRGARRVPEATLHLIALFCGWPGAGFAQIVFRHKTVKTSFRILFFLTVLLNIAAVTGLVIATTR